MNICYVFLPIILIISGGCFLKLIKIENFIKEKGLPEKIRGRPLEVPVPLEADVPQTQKVPQTENVFKE